MAGKNKLAWKTRQLLPVYKVFDCNFDLLEVIENVQLRKIKGIIAIDEARMFHDHKI